MRVLFGIVLLLAALMAGMSAASAQGGAYDPDGYVRRPGDGIADDADVQTERQRALRRKRLNADPADGADSDAGQINTGQSQQRAKKAQRPQAAQPGDVQSARPREHAPQDRKDDAARTVETPPVPERRDITGSVQEATSATQSEPQSEAPADAKPQGQSAVEAQPAVAKPEAQQVSNTQSPSQATDAQPVGEPAGQADAEAADYALDKMIGQMLVVGFRGVAADEDWTRKLAEQIKSGAVGGVLFMGHNIRSPKQVTALAGQLRRANAETPVFLGLDQEGGLPQDKGFKQFPSASQVGKVNDPLYAYTVYNSMAKELSELGFNVSLGPIADLQRSSGGAASGDKDDDQSFGPTPNQVAVFAKAFCVAYHDAGVLTMLKHFPGQRDTRGKDWNAEELDPYRQLIPAGNADMVMVGHVAHPAFSDEPGLPASLSEKAVTKLLRGELGFAGVIISDDLEKDAVAKRFSLEESAVRAIKAGNDLVLISNQSRPSAELPEKLTAAIRQAVQSGALRREALQASLDRIMGLKQKLRSQGQAVASAKGEGDAQHTPPAQ